jgi:hypothetical protein
MCIGLEIICSFLALPCVTAVSRHVYWFRNNKKQIIPNPIHMSTYSSYTWKSQEGTDYS